MNPPYKYAAIGDKVLMEAPEEIDSKAEIILGGITVPARVAARLNNAQFTGFKILDVGPDVKNCKIGDTGLINKHHVDMFMVTIGLDRFISIQENQLAAVLRA